MKKVLLMCLAITAITMSCSSDDTSQSINNIPQKSNPVDIRITPNIGDVIDVDVIHENEPPTNTYGSIKLTIICKKTVYVGVAGDDWDGIGKDSAGNYYIVHSTIDASYNSSGKIVYTRHTRGYKYSGSGRPPGYPC